ncbi:kynureninase [soil metagenome]
MISLAKCEALDSADPLRAYRGQFELPDGVIYLDGNSLGALPKAVAARVARTVSEEWGKSLITSWNEHGWFDLPQRVGDRLGKLIGAPTGTVVACDTISANLYKLVIEALSLTDRKVILSDSGNFPTDLYIAQSALDVAHPGGELRIVEPESVASAITTDIAILMLTEVDYRNGRLHDMRALTEAAHKAGALTIWDLAHSAGALPVDLTAANADFALGCTYKYLNGGPGAPAFLYIRPDLQDRVRSPLSGWWGHEAPFAFDRDFRPAPGITRQQCGTQGILGMAALDAALDVWDGIDMLTLRRKSQSLSRLFIDQVETNCARHGLRLAGPRDLNKRGSQVSFHCPEAYAVMQALIAHGVIGDFRAPDIIRFGLAPLYIGYADIWHAADTLCRVLDGRLWDRQEYKTRAVVT